jgi:hypothetical protein
MSIKVPFPTLFGAFAGEVELAAKTFGDDGPAAFILVLVDQPEGLILLITPDFLLL